MLTSVGTSIVTDTTTSVGIANLLWSRGSTSKMPCFITVAALGWNRHVHFVTNVLALSRFFKSSIDFNELPTGLGVVCFRTVFTAVRHIAVSGAMSGTLTPLALYWSGFPIDVCLPVDNGVE